MSELFGRTALITGSTRGIGLAVAQRLSAAGAAVVINAHSSPAIVEEIAAQIISCGGKALAVPADVANRDEVDAMIDLVLDTWGKLDIVICAAGLNLDSPFPKLKPGEWQRVLDVNLSGTFHVCQAASGALSKSGHGVIVTFAAQTAFRGRLNGANYCAAKAGVVALTKCIALEMAPSVRANVVVPGLIETKDVINRFNLNDRNVLKNRLESIPLRRLGKPGDVAEVVTFLVSDRASYVTGQVWQVNGGAMM